MKPESYETKENLTISDIEEYLAIYEQYKLVIPQANDRFKAAELKLKALKNTPNTIEQTMSESQLYEMGNILWARNKTLQFIRVYVIGRQRLSKEQIDKVMVDALQNQLDASKLKTQIVNVAMEIPLTRTKLTLTK